MNISGQSATTKPLVSQLLAEDEGLRNIVEEFVSGLTERMAELRTAHEQLDWDLLRTLAHRLKGAGGSYGYPDLSELGKRMEDNFKAQRADDFVVWIQQFERLTAAASAGLRAS